MPEQVEDCVDAIVDDPDATDDESRAYAICKAQHEADVDDPPDVTPLAETDIPAEGLDALAEQRPDEWARFEAADYGTAWVGLSTGVAVYDGVEQEQDDTDFALDVLEVRQDGDDGPGEDGDLVGLGVDMPLADVYVDWNVEAWPEDEQLDGDHVSIYDSVDDLTQATGNDVSVMTTIEPEDVAEQQAETVTLRGLSQEALTAIRERYHVDVVE